jgi:hypothetical protein
MAKYTPLADIGPVRTAVCPREEVLIVRVLFSSGDGKQRAASEVFGLKRERYRPLKNYTQAKQTMQQYVELFPEDDFMRGLLAQVESPAGAR